MPTLTREASESTPSVCLFVENPNRPGGNLLEMLRQYAPGYLRIARIVEQYASSEAFLAAVPDALPLDNQLAIVLMNLGVIHALCKTMNMPVSARSLEKVIDSFRSSHPTNSITRQRVMEWYSTFESEVELHVYLQVLPHRLPYWTYEAGRIAGDEITKMVNALAAFPDAIYEATEAGNCLAYERFTACVYHLMRTAEFGLIAMAQTAGVSQEKINKGWDWCIQGIESKVKEIGSTKPVADWQSQVKNYSETCAWLTTIQKGWRNPVSHVPRTYSEDTAKSMFGATMTLFSLLSSYGIRQAQMPDNIPV